MLDKIKVIRSFIVAAPQDENTGNLLSYLSDLEKDVNGKKYGLVFEEHCEKIDEVLDTHTPVLTEEKDLFIDNGGQMNFLIEGDNLASLQLLEKTHNGKIDLAYVSNVAQRRLLSRSGQQERADSLTVRYIAGFSDISDKELRTFPLFPAETKGKDVDYDRIVTEIKFNEKIENLSDAQKSSILKFIF